MKKKIQKKIFIKKSEKSPVLFEVIEKKILILRGKKIMIDRDLAELYGVSTKSLNQAVKRNIDRFPDDFMFQFQKEETNWWKSQFVTSKSVQRGVRKMPLAFTEQGIAMLSSVLRSKRAVAVNVQFMRTFIRLCEYMRDNVDIIVFDAIKKIIQYDVDDKKRVIGFTTDNKKRV